MEIKEEIRQAYEYQGFAVEDLEQCADGSFNMTVITQYGIQTVNVIALFTVRYVNKRQRKNPIPNE